MHSPFATYMDLSLPTELLQRIILELWSSPMCSSDRITFMTSSVLVSHTWSSLFTSLAIRDVYIPCRPYYEFFFRGGCPLWRDESRRFETIKSITIQVDTHKARYPHDPGDELSGLLFLLRIYFAPDLRTFHVMYTNGGFDDIFKKHRFEHFPSQIANLEISFSFSKETSEIGEKERAAYKKQDPTLCRLRLRYVRNLTVSGASDAFVEDILACCPNATCISLHR